MNSNEDESKNIHSNSWEIEILISGGAFFSLYQLSGAVLTFSEKLFNQDIEVLTILFLLVLIAISLKILSIYFALHLMVRAFWLSLVLLQKIYPKGINAERFNLAEPFQSTINRFNLNEKIIYTDKLSGLVFSWAVTFVLVLTGMSLAFCSISILFIFIQKRIPPDFTKSWNYFSSAVYISWFIFLIDIFFYGFLRRSRFLSKIYYPIYLFWNTISLGFLWRPSLQIIFTNVKSKWKASGFVLLVTIFVGFMSGDENFFTGLFAAEKNETEGITVDETRYLDKWTDATKQEGSFIQSDVITDNFLKVFVNYGINYRADSLKTSTKYSESITLSVNDSVYVSPTWIGITRVNGQKGIQTVIDISHLSKKMHILKIQRGKKKPIVIPFWKQ